jgi:hypothetical protein
MKKKSSKQSEPAMDEDLAATMFALTEQFRTMPGADRESFMSELEASMESAMSERDVHAEYELDGSGRTASVSSDYLTDGPSQGVDVYYIDNGVMEIAVLPVRGMGIWKITHRDIERDIGWQSPVRQPVHPSLVNLEARNGLGWLEGFNELMCRCGLASNGPPGNDPDAKSPVESALTLHGRIANLPAADVQPFATFDDPLRSGRKSVKAPESIGLKGTVNECLLFGPQLRMHSSIESPLLSNDIIILDTIENTGSTKTELQLLYHINVGWPILEAGAQVHLPAATVVPRDMRAAEGIDHWPVYRGPTPGYTEEGFYFEPKANADGESVALLSNAAGNEGFAVRFLVETLPRFVLWKCTQPEADGYVTGLEPATNFPNFKAYERQHGRVLSLEPGETYSTRVTLSVLTTKKQVDALRAEIDAIQDGQPPVVHRTPQPGWSPAGEPK